MKQYITCSYTPALARILHEGERSVMDLYCYYNQMLQNKKIQNQLQFVRVVL